MFRKIIVAAALAASVAAVAPSAAFAQERGHGGGYAQGGYGGGHGGGYAQGAYSGGHGERWARRGEYDGGGNYGRSGHGQRRGYSGGNAYHSGGGYYYPQQTVHSRGHGYSHYGH